MRRLNLTIIAGLVAALLGALLVFSYGRNVEDRIAEGKETVPVLVTTAEVEMGTSAQALGESVELQQIPREYLSEAAIDDLNEVAGLALVAPLPVGMQLTRGLFSADSQTAALQPEEGNIAVAVQVGLPAGVARYIGVGNFVDVFATYERRERGGQPTEASDRTKLFMSGVRVLSVSIAPPNEEEDRSGQALAGDQVIAVLEASPRDAELLVNAATLGRLYLALSAEGDDNRTPRGATPEDVVRSNKGRSES